jgi:hypothetical protein
LVRFGAVWVLGLLWTLGSPLFVGPDEPSHTVKAAAVVRGQLLPDKVPDSRLQFVTVPSRLDAANASAICIAFKPQQDASCVDYSGPTEDAKVPTYVGRYPPALYAVIGLPTLVSTSVAAIYAMRLLFVTITALCVASALADLDELGGRLARVGILVALTPMTLFLSGTINPSAAEIATALLVWTSALRLVRRAEAGTVSGRDLARCGSAALVLVLTRPLSPLWLACIGAVIAIGFAPGAALGAIAASWTARAWAAVLAVACAAQTAWVLLAHPIYGSSEFATEWTMSETLRNSIGRLSAHVREMIGVFGWLDTPAPDITRLVWLMAVGLLLLAAVAAATWRERGAIGLLLAVVIIVPVMLEAKEASELGLTWQGRYTLPVAAGLPLLGAVLLSRRLPVPPTFVRSLTTLIAVALATGHVLAFWQSLRRFSVGSNGPLLFFWDARWDPPVPSFVLLLAYVGAVSALMWSAVTLGSVAHRPPEGEPSRT